MDRNEAIKVIKDNLTEIRPQLSEAIQILIPELKESEDEKIRKMLIEQMERWHECALANNVVQDIKDSADAITYLEKQGEHANFRNKIQIGDEVTRNEDGILVNLSQLDRVAKKRIKQGEQKSTDKVEPKFKVGDYVTNNQAVWCIENIHNGFYNLKGPNGYIMRSIELKTIDNDFHLWTIQDAKDGDVLCFESGWTCIFKALNNCTNTFSSYCFMDNTKWFCDIGSECHTLDEEFITAYGGGIYPATKEQRDLLFQKMKEAGYEWDDEKNELRKIEHNPTEDNRKISDSAWSEEDKGMMVLVAKILDNHKSDTDFVLYNTPYENVIKWLKSLKNRAQPQSKQEWSWSKEDEAHVKSLCKRLKGLCRREFVTTRFAINEDEEWLKSIKEKMKGE